GFDGEGGTRRHQRPPPGAPHDAPVAVCQLLSAHASAIEDSRSFTPEWRKAAPTGMVCGYSPGGEVGDSEPRVPRMRRRRAGLPATTPLGGTSLVTTEPAPITAPAPMVT